MRTNAALFKKYLYKFIVASSKQENIILFIIYQFPFTCREFNPAFTQFAQNLQQFP